MAIMKFEVTCCILLCGDLVMQRKISWTWQLLKALVFYSLLIARLDDSRKSYCRQLMSFLIFLSINSSYITFFVMPLFFSIWKNGVFAAGFA